MLTEEEIKAIAHKSERIVVTGDAFHTDVGLKVGNYSQATSITPKMSREQQERAIRRLQTDLVMMNQKEEWQRKKASEGK